MFESIIGAFIGAAAGLITFKMQNNSDKSKNFSDVVTKERIKTINYMRNLIARICTIMSVESKNEDEETHRKYILVNSIYKLRMLLSIHFERVGNEMHVELENELKNLIVMKNPAGVDNIIKISKYIFDYEWNRIKEEAGGVND